MDDNTEQYFGWVDKICNLRKFPEIIFHLNFILWNLFTSADITEQLSNAMQFELEKKTNFEFVILKSREWYKVNVVKLFVFATNYQITSQRTMALPSALNNAHVFNIIIFPYNARGWVYCHIETTTYGLSDTGLRFSKVPISYSWNVNESNAKNKKNYRYELRGVNEIK